MKNFLLLLLFLFYSAFAFGQNLVTYDFTGASGSQVSTATASVATNMTASVFSRGSGVTASGAGGSISSSGWTTSTSIDANDYYEFTLTPNAGYKLDLDVLEFAERRSGTGVRNFEIRTSLDSYTASYSPIVIPDNTATRNQSFTFPVAFSSVTTSITIRIYGYNAEAGTGTWRIENHTTNNNFSLTGTVNSTSPSDINLTFDDNGDLNIAKGSNNNVIFRTQADVTSAAATLNQVVLRTNGTYTNTDIKANGFKLWYSADATFDIGDTQLSQVNSVGGNGETITFSALSQSIAINTTGYFFVTADITSSAILNHTVGIATTTTADFTFAAPSNKIGTSNSGNLHTIIGLSVGSVSTSFCVTPTQGEPISIPFTYSPTGLYTGNFTAQLSNAAGSFAAPTSIGLVASNNTGSQSISAIIPANTPQGSNYRIRVVSSVPSIESGDNGTNITIDLLTVSIAPAATQNLSQFQNGTTLTVTESSAIESRRWKYRTAPSLVYSSFLSSNVSETPYFETAGTYFMVVETKFACGKTVISNEVQINVTTFVGTRLFPGDMAIVGWDAVITGATDEYAITNLVPLKQGTKFLVANMTYENGNTANTRTNVWQDILEYIEFTYTNTIDLPAGSIISFEFNNSTGDNAKNLRINGIATTDITSVAAHGTSKPNISTGGADQIFIMQGTFNSITSELDGYVLFGMTNGSNWINLSSNAFTARTSRLHPHILCINTVHAAILDGSYFNFSNPAFRNASQATILGHITNMANWTTASSLPAAVHTTTFNVTSSTIKSQWIGSKDTNWFDCLNWSSLYVPDEYTDVAITSTAIGNARIDVLAAFSNDFLDIAKARELLIENRKLLMYDSRLSRLDIYKNLTIQNIGSLDMENVANATDDGTIRIKGNWINNVGTAAFIEGRSIVVFEGGNNQTVTTLAGDKESFYDITLNNGQDLTINNETILKNGLLFQAGNIISTATNPFTFDFDGSHTGANVNRHIRGASRRLSNKVENFVFPIGKSGIYRPITVHTQSGGAITQFFAEYFFAGYGTYQPALTPLHHVSQLEYWILNRESGTSNAQLTLSWGIESDVQTLGSLVVTHWTSANQWESKGNALTTGNPTAGTVKSSDIITQFSPFTLGTTLDNNILPVTWLSFDAKYNQEQENVLLEWKTLAEHQNQSFAVERSENGIDFKEIGIKKGGLTKNSIQNYQFWDFEPLQSKTYYRIKQIDTNGKFSYSTIKMIETEKDTKLGITNYENKTILYSNLDQSTKAKIKIYDMNGNTVSFFEVFLKAGQNQLLLPLNLSNAVYIYKIELEKQCNKINFVNGKFMVK